MGGGENAESGSTPFADSGDVSWGSDESGDETVAQDAAKARKKRVKARAVEKLAAMDYDAEEIAQARQVVRQARAEQERRRIHREYQYKGRVPVDEGHEGDGDDVEDSPVPVGPSKAAEPPGSCCAIPLSVAPPACEVCVRTLPFSNFDGPLSGCTFTPSPPPPSPRF